MRLRYRVLLCLLVCRWSLFAQAAGVSSSVDERTELLSIVFRLAGNEEYGSNLFASYAGEVDQWFAPVGKHRVVKMAARLRRKYGTAYDAPMSLALRIERADGAWRLDDRLLDEAFLARWGGAANCAEFLRLLNDFYAESRFQAFWERQTGTRRQALERFNALTAGINYDWFTAFFGTAGQPHFHLVVSLLNGSANYGVTLNYPDGHSEVYSCTGTNEEDASGGAVYSDWLLPIVTHELCHAWCNPLVDKHWELFQSHAPVLFAPVADVMVQSAYPEPRYMIHEMMVWACVFQYQLAMGQEDVREDVERQQRAGFWWIDRLHQCLCDYVSQRAGYPTLDSYMPVVARLHNSLTPP